MAYKIIEIPGGTTTLDDAPQVQIIGSSGTGVTVVIKYNSSYIEEGKPSRFGEITFSGIFEYRWVKSDFEYEAHPEHEGDYEFGLIEIMDSAYIEDMASKGSRRDYPGERFGFGRDFPESRVRHFRLAFDDYGRFDVIAVEVTIKEIDE